MDSSAASRSPFSAFDFGQLGAAGGQNPLLASFMAQMAMAQMFQQQQQLMQQQPSDKSTAALQKQMMEAAMGVGPMLPVLNPFLAVSSAASNPLGVLQNNIKQCEGENGGNDTDFGAPRTKKAKVESSHSKPPTATHKTDKANNNNHSKSVKSEPAAQPSPEELMRSQLASLMNMTAATQPQFGLQSTGATSDSGVDFTAAMMAAINNMAIGVGQTSVGGEDLNGSDNSPQKRARTRITE